MPKPVRDGLAVVVAQASSSMIQRPSGNANLLSPFHWQRRCLRAAVAVAVLAVAILASFGSAGWCQESADAETLDLGNELPRIEPHEPDAALSTFTVADGYRIELVAAEPLVADPVAMAFDEDGRLYVVQMRGYSEQGDQGLGSIRLLSDADGDGRLETSTLFADGLSWPTAIACYQGGVFVGAAPDLLYLKDTDDDGRADVTEKVFTGFGRTNVQGLLNSFRWGLDNRIYGATSGSGGSVRPASAPNSEPTALSGRDFAFDPHSRELSAVSGGAQNGLTFNRWGDRFVCHNSDHLQMIAIASRYLKRNPFQTTASQRRSIAVDGRQAEVYRASPVEPWRIVRTRLRVQGRVPGPVEGGGRAAGYFTSATGITVYEGDAWPDSQRGVILVADVGSNIIHRKRLQQIGARTIAERMDAGAEFIASHDIWFRPVQMANGPDGALYVADMYREVIEHPLSLPPSIKKHLDLTSGNDRGRIYRIVPTSFKQPKLRQLGDASTEELVMLLEHPNAWHRRTAARLLYERKDASATEKLRDLARNSQRPEGRIGSLYGLSSLSTLDEATIEAALCDAHPQVRRHGLVLAEPRIKDSQALRQAVAELSAEEEDPLAARQLALTLGELEDTQRVDDLIAVAKRHRRDREVLNAVLSSLLNGAGRAVEGLMSAASFRDEVEGRRFLKNLLAQIGQQQRPEDVESVQRAARASLNNQPRLTLLLAGLAVERDNKLFAQLVGEGRVISEATLGDLVAQSRKVVLANAAPLSQRIAAVEALRWAPAEELLQVAEELLGPEQPRPLQSALFEVLSRSSAEDLPDRVLPHFTTLTPTLQEQAAGLLLSRPAWALAVLHAMERGEFTLSQFGRYRIEQLARYPNEPVRLLASQLLSDSDGPAPAATLDDFRDVLEATGDRQRGLAVFRKHCATCHQHQRVGYPLGPNLAAAGQRGPESVLDNILAPNREVDPRYASYVVQTDDGRVFSGLVADETEVSVTLQRGEGAAETILRDQIERMENTGRSLMPEGLAGAIDRNSLADLLAFLCSSP